MSNYKYLVLSDLDGTLLDSSSSLSQNTIDYVHNLNKRDDILFSFSTGRPWDDCKHIYDALQLKGFVSCSNSAFIYNPHDEFIHVALISPEVWGGILRSTVMMHNLVHGRVLCGKLSINFTAENAPKIADEVEKKDLKVHALKMYFDNINVTPEIQENFSKKVAFLKSFDSKPNALVFNYPGLLNIEMQAKYVNKERAVEFLGNYYNIAPENILTFGDGYNDLAAMEGKSNSCAVANALNLVKQKAKYLSPFSNDQDAVIKEIEQFLIKKDKCCKTKNCSNSF